LYLCPKVIYNNMLNTVDISAKTFHWNQINAFWKMLQLSDESVQYAIYTKLDSKYKKEDEHSRKDYSLDYIDKLNELSQYDEDWDDEGAPKINSIAIENAKILVGLLSDMVLSRDLKLFPTETGAVSFKLATDKGMLRLELGDGIMSYFLRLTGQETVYHSFEVWNSANIENLVSSFNCLV